MGQNLRKGEVGAAAMTLQDSLWLPDSIPLVAHHSGLQVCCPWLGYGMGLFAKDASGLVESPA